MKENIDMKIKNYEWGGKIYGCVKTDLYIKNLNKKINEIILY
jgi:hypothetical protein